MIKFVNRGERTFGEYGEPGYQNRVSDEVYEDHRFASSREGRARNRHELALVGGFARSLPTGATVLDVPCGMGRFTDTLIAAGHVPISIDLNAGMLQHARERRPGRGALVQADVFALPLADGAIDAALCFRLLHHLPDNMILKALSELRRVCRTALVTYYDTRSFKYLRKTLRGKPTSGQYYSAAHVQTLAREAGWREQVHVNPFDLLHNLHALRLVA